MALRIPAIVVNFKTYAEASGPQALALAKLCAEVASETGASIVVAPPTADLALVASSVRIPVFAQHLDSVPSGSTTGHVTVESAKLSGAAGTLVNHSERRLKIAEIHELIDRCRGASLETIVCTNNLAVSKACAAMEPDFVAVEPPELIGGDVSVTTANPKIVSDTVRSIRQISGGVGVLCGAGVKNGRDVAKALELGTDGVLLASGVVKAKDRRSVLMDLVAGLKA
ncbi:MAG: triose-phosphate isomerase [Euryarchaeota archaeon RBG_16_62_10]|nr:MAG: triose-phosphate isomerase [Euryarchaeota archaeon RBG_16_62_10]